MSNGRRILAAVLVGVGALVYGISPIDIIPELIAGPFGFIDDLGVVAAAGFAIYKLLTGRSPGKGGATPPPAV
ncbi:hypothetical protein BH11ACT5_BH11ACT5_02590 [soil metagenome]